jgi:hypothetical protein
VTVTNAATLAQLVAINNETDAAVVLTSTSTALSGTVADLTAAFAGTITTYTGDLTVTNGGTIQASTLSTIDQITTGHIIDGNMTILTGNMSQVLAITNNIASTGSNKFSLGTMRGDTSDISAILSGSSANASDLLAVEASITGHITASGLTSLTGSSTDLQLIADNFSTIGSDKFTLGTLVGNVSNVEIHVADTTISAAVIADLAAHTSGNVDIASHATIMGTVTELNNLFAYSNVHPNLVGDIADFNVIIRAVPYLDTNTQGILDYLAQYTNGNIGIVGTSSGQTFDFSSYTGHAPGNLTLDAGGGNDTIIADADFAMILTGGLGKDVFTFTLAGADTPFDTITDFGTGDLNSGTFNNALI